MSAEKATALVLRLVEFSETSLVVTLFTREFGKIRGKKKCFVVKSGERKKRVTTATGSHPCG